MNLIEQQTAAKELPMQYLQQAVNGQNPNLTPWIATAELQRRTTMNQHMQNAQAPQGPQPTVKDQVEQKAGLMATQAAQQAQAAQAQQSSPPPGPVPAGVPQPEPQSEEPVMAARGGLMEAPVNFQFAHGGILGYAGDEDGSYVDPASGMAIRGMPDQGEAAAGSGALGLFSSEPEWKKAARARAKGERYVPPPGYNDEGLPIKQQAAAPAPAVDDRTRRPSLQGQGIKDALPKAPPTGGPQRAPTPPAAKPAPQTAAPTTPEVNPLEQALTKYSTSETPQASMQGAIGNEQQLAKAYNLDQPMGVEERDIIAQRNAAREAARQRQAKDAFAAYAAGTIGVPGSAGLAYSQARQAQDAAEREHLSANLKDIRDLNTAQRAALEKRATTAGSEYGADKLAAAGAAQNKATVGANVYGTQQQAKTSKYNTDEQVKSAREIALLRERAENARQGSSDARQAANELRDRERAVEADITALTSRANKLTGSFSVEDRKELADINEALKNARAQKAMIRGGPAAPTGTMAPDRAAQFKVIR